tara:strand:+ start:2413 stop:3294 length:882 start_codon:yes stop_codon:yes gene_type:complete
MIFRKKKEKSKVVKFSVMVHWDRVEALKNKQTTFDAWCTYPAMRSCPTYKNMKVYPREPVKEYKNKARETLEFFKNIRTEVKDLDRAFAIATEKTYRGPAKTMRSCPAIKDLLTHTLAIKAPVDLHFAKISNIDPNDKRWYWTCPNPNLIDSHGDLWNIHPPEQYCYGKGSQFEGYANLKINTSLSLELPDGITCVQHAPVFHKIETPYVVIPGMYTEPFTKAVHVIFNVLIKDDQEDFVIPKGDVLYYITFSENVKFEEDKGTSDYLTKFRYGENQLPWKYFSKKLTVDGED